MFSLTLIVELFNPFSRHTYWLETPNPHRNKSKQTHKWKLSPCGEMRQTEIFLIGLGCATEFPPFIPRNIWVPLLETLLLSPLSPMLFPCHNPNICIGGTGLEKSQLS